jgi:hypothetical protein
MTVIARCRLLLSAIGPVMKGPGAIHPGWDPERCTATAYQVLTLTLGGWITMGNSRAVLKRRSRKSLKAIL